MSELLFFVEEESCKILIEHLTSRLNLDARYFCQVFHFSGKQDLERRLPARLRAFRQGDQTIFVLRDQDSRPDCRELKAHLRSLCIEGGRPDAVIRVVCHELEAWFLGDLAAVEAGFSLQGLARRQKERKFRSPDALNNAKQELMRLTERSEHGPYQERIGTRRIAPCLDLDANRSVSFNVFLRSLRELP